MVDIGMHLQYLHYSVGNLFILSIHVHVHVHISTRSVNREASTAVSDNVDESARLYPAAYLDLRYVCACTCVCVPSIGERCIARH